MQWRFEWLTSWDEIWSTAWTEQWQDWLRTAPAPHVFVHPSLVRAWVETCLELGPVTPCFCIAEAEGVRALLPLVIRRASLKQLGCRVLTVVGANEYDYHDPLVTAAIGPSAEADFWAQLLPALQGRWGRAFDRLLLPGVRRRGPPSEAWEEAVLCPQLDVSGAETLDQVLAHMPKRKRGDIRRRGRRLAEQGVVRYVRCDPGAPEEIRRVVSALLSMHATRWPGAYKMPGFHLRLAERSAAAGVLHLSELHLDGRPLSWHLGFRFRDCLYWYMPAYDPAAAAYAPGKQHLCACIGELLTTGGRRLDFLRGDESYKWEWTDASAAVYTLDHWQPGAGAASRRVWGERLAPFCRRVRHGFKHKRGGRA